MRQNNITVEAFLGSVTNAGLDYVPDSYSTVDLLGGNGSGAVVNFEVNGLAGDITQAGSGYTDAIYNGIDFTGVKTSSFIIMLF